MESSTLAPKTRTSHLPAAHSDVHPKEDGMLVRLPQQQQQRVQQA
jgi:hypothetical protein